MNFLVLSFISLALFYEHLNQWEADNYADRKHKFKMADLTSLNNISTADKCTGGRIERPVQRLVEISFVFAEESFIQPQLFFVFFTKADKIRS